MGYMLKWRGMFAGAHILGNYEGKCGNLHGHNWTVEIYVTGYLYSGPDQSMLIDFNELKRIVNEYDHKLLVNKKWVKRTRTKVIIEVNDYHIEMPIKVANKSVKILPSEPTAENLSRLIAEEIQKYTGIQDVRVDVYETPNNIAVYTM